MEKTRRVQTERKLKQSGLINRDNSMKESMIGRTAKALEYYGNGVGGAMKKVVKSGYQLLNFQETFGIRRIYTVHIWNNLMIFDAITKFLLLGVEE